MEKKIKLFHIKGLRIPNSPINFNEEQLEPIEKMLDKMEDDEDVQYVYTNIS